MWALAYVVIVTTIWFLVLAATTQEEGLTYCSVEAFDALSASYFINPVASGGNRNGGGGDLFYETF